MIPRLPNPPLHRSIADVAEDEFVRQLIDDPHWRGKLFHNIMGMPSRPRILQRLPLAEAPGSFRGDADVVLFAPGAHEAVTAVEMKRIKIGATSFASGEPNKLQEYAKAVQQANLLAKVGFAQVYLYVLVVVDSRKNNNGEFTYAGPTPELEARVRSVISLKDLEPRVGLIVHDFVQPMDHPPLELGTYGGQLHRLATPVPQALGIAEWIRRREQSPAG